MYVVKFASGEYLKKGEGAHVQNINNATLFSRISAANKWANDFNCFVAAGPLESVKPDTHEHDNWSWPMDGDAIPPELPWYNGAHVVEVEVVEKE